MKTIDDVLERLDGEGCAMVVQLSAAECRAMAAVIREVRMHWLLPLSSVKIQNGGR